MQKPDYNPQKLKALFHYVIKTAGARPGFGAVKLYKVAWFSDAKFYVIHGRPITGATYIREKYGPVPREGMHVRKALVQEGAITQTQGREYEGWRFRALTNPDLTVFEQGELDTINYWLKHIDGEHTATSISEESHDLGWELAAMGEELPLYAFFANRVREPNEEEMEWGRSRAKELGLP